jgi:hypothetical protein
MKRFEDLKGQTLVEIIGKVGDEEMVFVTNTGERAVLYYEQD